MLRTAGALSAFAAALAMPVIAQEDSTRQFVAFVKEKRQFLRLLLARTSVYIDTSLF